MKKSKLTIIISILLILAVCITSIVFGFYIGLNHGRTMTIEAIRDVEKCPNGDFYVVIGDDLFEYGG